MVDASGGLRGLCSQWEGAGYTPHGLHVFTVSLFPPSQPSQSANLGKGVLENSSQLKKNALFTSLQGSLHMYSKPQKVSILRESETCKPYTQNSQGALGASVFPSVSGMVTSGEG